MKWFISDTHFGHRKLSKIRGFQTVEEHDRTLLENINKRVGKRDQLFILGDFGSPPGRYKIRIECKDVTLIRGNHDKHQKSINAFGTYEYIVNTQLLGKHHCVLCHYPMIYWYNSHHGWYHLYGHCHGNREGTLDELLPERRSMDITVDNLLDKFNDYGPINEEQVYGHLKNRKGHDPLSFYTAKA